MSKAYNAFLIVIIQFLLFDTFAETVLKNVLLHCGVLSDVLILWAEQERSSLFPGI